MNNVQGAEPEVRSVFTVKTNRGNTEKWLKASSYLVASALIAALAWQFTHEAVRFSQGDSQLNSVNNAAAQPGEAGTDDSRSEQPPANTHLNASIASIEVLKQRSAMGSNSAAEQAWAALGRSGEAGVSIDGNHRLSVSTSADTWVEIFDAEGEQLEMDLIRAGISRVYDGKGPFRVMIGRASAVVLTLDGETVDLGPHTRGNVARMTLGTAQLAGGASLDATENR
jgi:cytoskeleton protein RodZ